MKENERGREREKTRICARTRVCVRHEEKRVCSERADIWNKMVKVIGSYVRVCNMQMGEREVRGETERRERET